MHARLRKLVGAALSAPAGTLSLLEQKFLMAALLASIITADDRIHPAELAHYAELLSDKLQLPEGAIESMADIISHGLSPEELEMVCVATRKYISIEARVELAKQLWGIALSDGELHPKEKVYVHQIAGMIGVRGLRAFSDMWTEVSQMKSEGHNAQDL